MPPIRLSDEGRRELGEELVHLEARRAATSARIADARAGGADPTENLDLRDAVEDFQRLEVQIQDLRRLLAAAEPLERAGGTPGTVRQGVTATVRHSDGEEADYRLVAAAEADPRRGRISVDSPIGRALLGAGAGDRVVAETPGGRETLEVLRLR